MMSRHIYTLRKPAAWHHEKWRESLPLGNGLTGVLIPGEISEESIQFNRHDLWNGGNDGGEIPDITEAFNEMRKHIDAGDYVSANQSNLSNALHEKGYHAGCECPYPLGWLDLKYVPKSMFRQYRRGVNMRTGEAFVAFSEDGCRYHRQMFVSRDSDIAVLRMHADREFTSEYSFRLFCEANESILTPNSIFITAKDGETAANVLFCGDFVSCIKNGALEITGKDYTVLIRCSSHGSPLELEPFSTETYDSLLKKHTTLHTALYDSVTIELAGNEDHSASNEHMLLEAYDDQASPALLERLWRFGRYLFISAASEKGNPIPLYGLWHGRDELQWSQYVANENVEMTYWHAMAGDLAYAIPPLLRHYTSKLDKFRECARKIFGARGIWISAYTSPNVSGACVPVVVIINWISCAGWLCRHFWDYYLYSGDEKLLREEILPFMYEAALFYRDYAADDGTTIRLYPSVSPENTPANLPSDLTPFGCTAVQNATMDFAILKELLTNLLKGIEITGMYCEEVVSFRELLAKIPEYQTNSDGAIREWMHPDLSENYHHRHLSHIYPVFPGTEVTQHNNPDLFEKFRRAVDLRELGSQSGWSLTHMASIYARMGDAEKSAECLDIMAKSVIHDSLLTVHNDWRRMGMTVQWGEDTVVQLDAAFGAVNAVQEMLFCRQEEALSVLPALPERLTSGKVCGLVFPEGRIAFHWDASGKISVTIHAKKTIDTTLLICRKAACSISLNAGESNTWEFNRFV